MVGRLQYVISLWASHIHVSMLLAMLALTWSTILVIHTHRMCQTLRQEQHTVLWFKQQESIKYDWLQARYSYLISYQRIEKLARQNLNLYFPLSYKLVQLHSP